MPAGRCSSDRLSLSLWLSLAATHLWPLTCGDSLVALGPHSNDVCLPTKWRTLEIRFELKNSRDSMLELQCSNYNSWTSQFIGRTRCLWSLRRWARLVAMSPGQRKRTHSVGLFFEETTLAWFQFSIDQTLDDRNDFWTLLQVKTIPEFRRIDFFI